MNGRKAIWEIEQPYPSNRERSEKQDRHRQDKTDSSSDIPDGRQLETLQGTQGDHREAFETGRDRRSGENAEMQGKQKREEECAQLKFLSALGIAA